MNGAAPDPNGWRRSALFTDQYQLVMAQVYLEAGLADRTAQFDYLYRSNPDYGSHQAGFGVFAGLEPLLDWMATVSFTDADLEALASQHDPNGRPRFSREFLDWLADNGHFRDLEVRGVAEGRVIHPRVPVLSVIGPLAIAQLLETALLNQCNYPTLVATKAARVVDAARGGQVLEFGMRRGPGAAVDEAARACLIAGCDATSNVQVSIALGTDPKGTHAHSLVQAYLALGHGELAAFRAFARRYPDECILLVDTVDTLASGIPNAIRVFSELRDNGHRPLGVRLDSGDLAYLAVESARLLDEAGFDDVRIVLSGELDELTIWQILAQIADEASRSGLDGERIRRRLTYGVGTRLITSAGDGSLGGVYKLAAIQDDDGTWLPALKLSENPAKIHLAGPTRCWRLYDRRGLATVDLVTTSDEVPFGDDDRLTAHHPSRPGIRRELTRDEITEVEEMHDVVFASGAAPGDRPDLDALRRTCRDDVDRLDTGVRRLVRPHRYHVSLSDAMHRRQLEIIERLHRSVSEETGV